LVCWLYLFSSCKAQEQVTPNIVQPAWSGVVTGNYNPQGFSGGNVPAFNPTTNTIIFGYTQGSAAQQIILSNVLSNNTGIRVLGYNYSWQYYNYDTSRGTASVEISLRNSSNGNIHQDIYSLPQNSAGWTSVSGTRTYPNQYSLSQASSVLVRVTGKDDRFWAGYYGPLVRNIDVSLRYIADECATNPLSSPSCSGYEAAYFTQQCTANPLYSFACPGYAQAYFNQQCTANPLYNAQCPGYQQAYFNQQCSASPLYNPQCPGYEVAYFTQQCNLNQLYSPKCPGYETAYFTQQCSLNALFSPKCAGYEQAFLSQQCLANTLYSAQCPGYEVAFRNKQITDACAANPQSNPSCKGYVAPQQATLTTNSTTSTTVVATAPPTVLLPGSDPVKSMTQPQIVSDPIVNQTLEKEPVKPEAPAPASQTSSTQQKSGSRQQTQAQTTQSRTQNNTARTAASAQPRASTEQKKEEDDKMASFAPPPGFSAYESARLPEIPFYRAEDIYKRVTLPDNARAQRLLNQRSDRIHKEMVDEQYRR